MAKTKKENNEEQSETVGDIKDAFKILDDLNPDAAFLDENSISNVKEWIDTGSLALNAIISGSNRVALQTRRGKGNYYSIFSDHVLVWYQNSKSIFGPTYDAPVQMIGKNLAYNPNYKDYFVRVKCDNKLTDEHMKHLEKLGYTRV
jgi:hypothetical protein